MALGGGFGGNYIKRPQPFTPGYNPDARYQRLPGIEVVAERPVPRLPEYVVTGRRPVPMLPEYRVRGRRLPPSPRAIGARVNSVTPTSNPVQRMSLAQRVTSSSSSSSKLDSQINPNINPSFNPVINFQPVIRLGNEYNPVISSYRYY